MILYRKKQQQAAQLARLSWSEQEYRKFVESSPNKIIRYDTDCRRTYVSFSSDYYLNVSADFLLGKTPSEFPGGESAISFERSIREAISHKTNITVNLDWQTDSGEGRVLRFELLPEFDAEGNVSSVLGIAQDITDIVESKQRIGQLISYDQLTHLPNRVFLTQQLNEWAITTPQQGFVLMLIDLDHFKAMNDGLGYSLANQLLCEIAKRLKAVLHRNDLLARLDGDEFVIVSQRIESREAAEMLAERIIQLFNQPFNIEAKEVFITCSLGVVFSPDDSDKPDALLSYADAAMYHAKKMGRNNFQFYYADLTKKSLARTVLDTGLRKAIHNNELQLYYQPQVALNSGNIIGAEALLRWKHPKLGMVPPDQFIPLAEETGMIIDIGNWVLLNAFQAAATWNQHRPIPLKIAVNLSSRQFVRNDLVGTVTEFLEVSGCKAEWIKLEITESLLLDEGSNILQTLMALSDMGFELSIDDFGTGYSALSYLTRYPISQIKIDRSFISDIPIDLEKCELVKVIIQIAKVLHLDLVAEGVETSEQVDFLNRAGCGVAQGYFYYKPMSQADFSNKVNALSTAAEIVMAS